MQEIQKSIETTKTLEKKKKPDRFEKGTQVELIKMKILIIDKKNQWLGWIADQTEQKRELAK